MRSTGVTCLVSQGEVLAVSVGQALGLGLVLGQLHRRLTALGEQCTVGQKGLLLPHIHVDYVSGITVLKSK